MYRNAAEVRVHACWHATGAREPNRRFAVVDDLKKGNRRRAREKGGVIAFKEATMTVRAILDTKGHQILSVPPEDKLSAAVKMLGERKIGAVLVMSKGCIAGSLSGRDM